MKKKLILILTAVVLVAAVLVGGTWAYYRTDVTEGTNVITIGKVDITAVAQRVPNEKIVPGVPFEIRHVNITNIGTTDAYVRVRVEATSKTFAEKFSFSLRDADKTSWKEWKHPTTNQVYFLYKTKLGYNASTMFVASAMPSVLLSQKEIESVYGTNSAAQREDFKISVEAIQADHMELDATGYPKWPDVPITSADTMK